MNKEIIYSYFYPNNVKIYPINTALNGSPLFQRRQGAQPNYVGTGSYRGDFKCTQKKKKKPEKLCRGRYVGCSLLEEVSHGEKTMRGR